MNIWQDHQRLVLQHSVISVSVQRIPQTCCLDSTPVVGRGKHDCAWAPSSIWAVSLSCYCIQQKLTKILLIGWNVFQTWWSALFVCAGEVDICTEAGAPRPGPLSFLFSYQRPQPYQFQISQEQRERERDHWQEGDFFLFHKVNRMSAPLTFHRGKQLFIKAQPRQRPTWKPSSSNGYEDWCQNCLELKTINGKIISLIFQVISPRKNEQVPLVPALQMEVFAVNLCVMTLDCCLDKTRCLKMSVFSTSLCWGIVLLFSDILETKQIVQKITENDQ